MSLRAKAIVALRWTSVSTVATMLMQLLQLALLARLLSPADFGTMAIALAIVGLLQLIGEAGLGSAVIQRQDTTADQLAGLFWLNLVAAGVLAAAAAAASGAIARLYGVPTLAPLVSLAAVHLLLASVSFLPRALAQRDLRFGKLAALETSAAAAGLVVAVGMAHAGFGVYALAAGLLAGSATAACLAWPLLAPGFRPLRRFRPAALRPHLGYGLFALASDLVNAVAMQVETLLGGRLLGAQALGLYNVARGLCLQVAGTVNPIATRVAFPVMARAQADLASLRAIYLRILAMTAAVNFPLYVALWLLAEDVVLVLLGTGWTDAVPLLRILAWWGLLRASVSPAGSLAMARGRADLNLRWNLAWLLALPPVVWLGGRHGAEGMAWAMLALGAVGWLIPAWYFLARPLCGVSFAAYFGTLARPLALALAAGAVAALAGFAAAPGLPRLALAGAFAALAYLLLSQRWNRTFMNELRELLVPRAA